MLIWGYSTRFIGAKAIDLACPGCKTTTTLINKHQRTFDVFFIPVFPYKNFYSLSCSECKALFEIDSNCKSLKEIPFKKSILNFSGLFIFAILMAYTAYNENESVSYPHIMSTPTQNSHFTFKNNEWRNWQ